MIQTFVNFGENASKTQKVENLEQTEPSIPILVLSHNQNSEKNGPQSLKNLHRLLRIL